MHRTRRRRHARFQPRRTFHGNFARDDRGAAEVVAEVGGRIPVFVDGGFRRGTDVFKALALGAKAVGIGRPFLWGLGAFGQAGVDRVIEIMQGELKLVMGNCGTRTVADITREYVATPDWKICSKVAQRRLWGLALLAKHHGKPQFSAAASATNLQSHLCSAF